MTINEHGHAEPVRLELNIHRCEWDGDYEDLLQAWREGYRPAPKLSAAELLARLQWHLAATTDEELQALAALALADPMEARHRLAMTLHRAATTPTPNDENLAAGG